MESSIHQLARQLRRGQTDAERRLWHSLRQRRLGGIRFRRQFPIGNYIVDFCRREQRLVVEVDGGQHVERVEADARRSEFLAARGYRVLRFWNSDVFSEYGRSAAADFECPDDTHTLTLSLAKERAPNHGH